MRTDDDPNAVQEYWLIIHAHDNGDGLHGVHLWHWREGELTDEQRHDATAAAMKVCGVPEDWMGHPTEAWQVSFVPGRPAAYFQFEGGNLTDVPREGVTVHNELPKA